MKRLLVVSLVLLFQLGLSQEIKEKSLLWEISGNGLEQSSYLFGTMHIMCQGDVVMTPELQNAFDHSEELLMELDMDDPNMMMSMMQVALSKDGKTVTEKLGEELSAKVDTILQRNASMNLSMLNQLNLQTLTMQLGVLALDCPMDLGYDSMLAQEAKTAGKEINGLETVEEQIKILFSQSDEEALQAITYLVDNFDEAREEMNNMIDLYKGGEVQELYDTTKSTFEDPKYPQGDLEEFLDNRNENWIPLIETQIKSKPTFIAVGAAHLAGENGVINLLKKQGYQLKATQ